MFCLPLASRLGPTTTWPARFSSKPLLSKLSDARIPAAQGFSAAGTINHLILELLHRAGAETDQPADLADADAAGRQEFPSFLDLMRLSTGTAKAFNRVASCAE
jgi:hypothetical protein